MNLPKDFIANVTRIWPDRGVAWLNELPRLINYFCSKWQLAPVTPFNNLSYNFVGKTYSHSFQKFVVLKIGIPGQELMREDQALEWYGGNVCVQLLAHDQQKGGMLLPLIEPGTTLRSLFPADDDRAVEYACTIMRRLHAKSISSTTDFPFIEKWFELFDTLKVPYDLQTHVSKARALAQELKADTMPQYLLHGDLHHDNILFDASGTRIAIDPKGVVGESAYEVGAFMCNPAELSAQPNVAAILARRLDQFSVILGIDHQRLAKACYIRIILSACWTVQDKGDWRDDVSFAEQFMQI